MIEPLRLTFDVACRPDQAFRLWTDGTTAWWPASHTAANTRGTRIIFEPVTGGRVFEKAPSGEERDWGVVLAWEPPGRLVYRWHLLSDPADATEVEVRFLERHDGTTTVELEHRGWDAFGDAQERRRRNQTGWNGLIDHYRQACTRLNPASKA